MSGSLSGSQFTYNNVFRLGVTSGLLLVPVVGGCVSSIAKALWPTDGSDPLDDLRSKVDDLVVQIEDDEWLITLRGILSDLRTDLKTLMIPDSPIISEFGFTPNEEWKLNFASTLNESTAKFDYFVHPERIQTGHPDDQPQNTIVYLVAYGTIHLSLLRERALHYHDIYTGNPTDDPQQTWGIALTDLLEKYVTDRDRAIDWRKGKVGINQNTYQPIMMLPTDSSAPEVTYKVTDTGDSGKEQDFDELATAQQYCMNILWDITTADGGFLSNLDSMMDAQRWWMFLDPLSQPPTAGFGYYCTRMGNGYRSYTQVGEAGHEVDDDYNETNAKMGKIEFYWDDGALKGMRTYQGPEDGGLWDVTKLHGTTATSTTTWTFRENELITAIGGKQGDWIDALVINTNLRAKEGQPPLGNTQQSQGMIWDVTDTTGDVSSMDEGIAYFGYINDGDVISQLQIVWKKWDKDNGQWFQSEHRPEALWYGARNQLPQMTTSKSGP